MKTSTRALVGSIITLSLLTVGGIAAAQSNFDDFGGGIFDNEVSVDLKVNGQEGPVKVDAGSRIVVSWTSEGASRCRGNWSRNDIKPSGTISGRISRSVVIKIACVDREGNRADDAVVVNIAGLPVLQHQQPIKTQQETPQRSLSSTPTPAPISRRTLLQVELDSNAPSHRLISAGATDVTMNVLRLRAVGEDVAVQSLALQISAVGSNSPSSEISNGTITLWKDNKQVGQAIIINGRETAVASIENLRDLVVPADGSVSVVIKTDIARQGTARSGTPGVRLTVDFDGNSPETYAVGLVSGQRAMVQGRDTTSAGVTVYRAIPTVKYIPLPTGSSLTAASDRPLYRFSVTASAGDNHGLGIRKFTLRFAAAPTKTILNNINVQVYSDQWFSSRATNGIQTDGTMQAVDAAFTGADVVVQAETPNGVPTAVQIPAGGTRYFEVIGDVSLNGVGPFYSVTTQLQGDTTVASNNFVWTPNTYTTITTGISDFFGGYSIPGLPARNLTPQVLSDKADGGPTPPLPPPPPPPPTSTTQPSGITVDLKATEIVAGTPGTATDGPLTVSTGRTVRLSYTTTGKIAECKGDVSGYDTGSTDVVPPVSKTYTVSCTQDGGSGTATDSVKIEVSGSTTTTTGGTATNQTTPPSLSPSAPTISGTRTAAGDKLYAGSMSITSTISNSGGPLTSSVSARFQYSTNGVNWYDFQEVGPITTTPKNVSHSWEGGVGTFSFRLCIGSGTDNCSSSSSIEILPTAGAFIGLSRELASVGVPDTAVWEFVKRWLGR